MIRITAKKDGFRRCGVAHSKTAKEYPNATFSAAQLAAMKNEPMLVVEEIADKKETAPKKETSAKA